LGQHEDSVCACGEVEVNICSLSLVDGSVNEESLDDLIGDTLSIRLSEKSRRKVFDVLVYDGSLESPSYRFYD